MLLAILENLARWTHFWWLLTILAALATLLIRSLPNLPRLVTTPGCLTQRRMAAICVLVFIASVAGCRWLDDFRERHKEDPEYGYTDISPGWSQICFYIRHNISNKRLLCLGRPENFPFTAVGTQIPYIPVMDAMYYRQSKENTSAM